MTTLLLIPILQTLLVTNIDKLNTYYVYRNDENYIENTNNSILININEIMYCLTV